MLSPWTAYNEEYNLIQEILKRRKEKERLENSLYEFVQLAWPQIEGISYVDGWHIKVICEHLEALYQGDIKNIIINLPPRTMKSGLVSVIFPVWVWTKQPEAQFLCVTNSQDLANKGATDSRNIITSEFYQRHWGKSHQLSKDQNNKTRYTNTKKGYRVSCTLKGKITGKGGSYVICDDSNNAFESDAERQKINEIWQSVLLNRVNDAKTAKRIVMQQRTHQHDLSGYIISKDEGNEWVRLILPMEYEGSRKTRTIVLPSTHDSIWEDPRTEEGQLLWPEKFSTREIKVLKSSLGSFLYSGQYQQRPSPAEGGIIKKSWFQWWKNTKVPKLEYVIQSWDTALETKEINNYSACITIGVFADEHEIYNAILLSAWRGRVDYPTLRRYAKRLYADYRDDLSEEFEQTPQTRFVPDTVLIEAKVSGISLVQDLIDARISATRFNPTKYGDKLQRVQLISHLIEDGRFWVPAQPPYYDRLLPFADMFVEACALFPNGDSRDIVDTLSQAMIRLKHSGWLKNSADRNKEEEWDY